MKKIVFQIVQGLGLGGLEILVLEIQRILKNDMEIQIINLSGTKETALRKCNRIHAADAADRKLHFLDKGPGFSISCIRNLYGLIKKFKPVAIHMHHVGPLLYAGLAAKLAGHRNIIYTEHDAWHFQEKKDAKIEKYMLSFAKPIITAVSSEVADVLKTTMPKINPILIYNGVDTSRFYPGDKLLARKIMKLDTTKTWIGCSGRFEYIKGQHLLIAALEHLPKHIHVVFGGRGSNIENLIKLAKEKNVHDRVKFFINVKDMRCFYQSLDLLCSPSIYEGMSMAVLEAQACNVPVIAAKTDRKNEALCPVSGKVFPTNNIKLIAKSIYEKLEDLKCNTPNPRNFILSQRNIKKTAKSYLDLYTSNGSQ